MLVSEENFVKVHGNVDFVVGEIVEPSTIGSNRIGQSGRTSINGTLIVSRILSSAI